MISLSYHYHNSRRREREALERKLSTKEGRRWPADVNPEEPSGGGGSSGGGQKSFSASPRRVHVLKKQTSEINVKKTSTSSCDKAATLNRPKRGFFSKLSIKKTNSFDNNNARQVIASKSVEDLSGLVTVREISTPVKPDKVFGDATLSASTHSKPVVERRRICSALDSLCPGALATSDVPLLKNVCLAKPEIDSDHDSK